MKLSERVVIRWKLRTWRWLSSTSSCREAFLPLYINKARYLHLNVGLFVYLFACSCSFRKVLCSHETFMTDLTCVSWAGTETGTVWPAQLPVAAKVSHLSHLKSSDLDLCGSGVRCSVWANNVTENPTCSENQLIIFILCPCLVYTDSTS